MERRLYEAAVRGDVKVFHQLIGENPLILTNYALNSNDNLLDVATKAGQLGIVVEIIRRKPDSVTQVNQDGYRPLEVASALGHVEIVKELISTRADQDLCRLKGREGRTAIHHAAINGKLEVMDELLSFSPECIGDETSLGETALHLAVKHFKFQAFKKLLEWLENLGMLAHLVNAVDKDGYTVLHLAVNQRQREVVEFLFSNINVFRAVNWNAKNSRGLTAMCIMDILILDNTIVSKDDVHLRDTLHRATILSGPTAAISTSTPQNHVVLNIINPNNNLQEAAADEHSWFDYFEFKKERESPSETRNTLLVVVVLIATVSFQAGVNPPSHLANQKHGSWDTWWFLLFNSIALISSLYVLTYLTSGSGFPFRRELLVSIFFMVATYTVSIMKGPAKAVSVYQFIIICFIAWVIPLLIRLLPDAATRIWRNSWRKRQST